MTKIHFQNLRSKKICQKFDFFSKFQKFYFSNWFFEEKFSAKCLSRKKSATFFFEKKSSKNQFEKWKFWNFKKSSENFQNFVNFFFDRKFFRRTFFRQKFFGYVFRSEIFWRFQKSHLENCASNSAGGAQARVSKCTKTTFFWWSLHMKSGRSSVGVSGSENTALSKYSSSSFLLLE